MSHVVGTEASLRTHGLLHLLAEKAAILHALLFTLLHDALQLRSHVVLNTGLRDWAASNLRMLRLTT